MARVRDALHPGGDRTSWPSGWRRLSVLGIVLSLVLLALALLLGWREHVQRVEQAALRAELVAEGAERQLRERLAQLAEELDELALADADTAWRLLVPGLRHEALRDVVLIRDDGRAFDVRGGPRPLPDLPPRRADGVPAGLQLLAPERGAQSLSVVWDGRPGVRVLALIDPGWFAETIAGHDLGAGSVLNLVHDSQRLYARSQDNALHLGRSLLGVGLFSLAHRSRARGRYDETSVFSGEYRQFVYRRVEGTPLTVVVGTPRQAIATPAWAFLALALLIAILLILFWLWLLRLFARIHQHQATLMHGLQDTAARLREVQSMASVGGFRWHLDSGELHWSQQTFRIYGRAPSAGQPSFEAALAYLHPDDVPRMRTLAEALRSGRGTVDTEFRIRRADGAMRWIHLRCGLSADGLRAEGVQQDVTDLATVRERLRLAQEIARIGDWEWDIASGEILWSDAVYAIYGVDPRAFRPHADNVFGFVHAQDRERLKGLAAALIESGEPCEAEFRIVRPDGGIRVISARGMRGIRSDGRVIIRSVQQDVTELAQARNRLLETEEQYRFLFQHNPVPMWVFDRETLALLAVNEAMTRHYGYSRAELLERSILDIRPPEERAVVEAVARREVAEGDRPQGQVWTHLRRDCSRLRMAIFTHDILFDERPARLVAAQDVTEREASEQRFQLVARATSDAIYDLDIASGALWWSDSFYTVFGYAREQVPATLHAWEEMVHPDDLARVNASLGAAIAAPEVSEWEEEYRFRRADGSHANVIDRGFFVREESGGAVRMVGGMLDVSEKRRRDADLRLLSRAIEATDNGVVIADARDPDLPLVYVNQAFEAMTGYRAAECLGRNCRFLQGDDRDQPGLESIRHAIEAKREARVVLRNYRKDGSLFWNELHIAPVLADDGAVTHFVGVQSDVSHRHHYEEELAHRATHDQLTGLPNRQLLLDRLQQAILNADRYGRQAGVVFIDLDDFKLVNDNLDHAAGDEALRHVAERLRTVVRDTDTVGRFGGDEFVVVLTEQTDEDGVGQVIARITAALSQPMQIGDIEHTLTPSIGWCRYPEGGTDAETLLKHADMAMYQAKRQGRNRAVAYRAEFDAHASLRLQLVAQLREALEQREFMLAFQPLFDGDGRAVALEALVRWRHPQRGLLLPAEFIGVCEESGLIIELGRRTLREAARHHALLAAAGHPGLRLAVNVSALQFDYALEDDVAAVMEEFSLPPGILELEITESVIMGNADRAIEAMRRISALGVCLSIDDFGTGYSSLTYLKRLPIHRLKIDRSFVQDLPHDREAASICDSIIGLAHSLDLKTVGEGVETPAQLEWLRANGCDEVQGYLLARPAAFDDILGQLAGSVRIASA